MDDQEQAALKERVEQLEARLRVLEARLGMSRPEAPPRVWHEPAPQPVARVRDRPAPPIESVRPPAPTSGPRPVASAPGSRLDYEIGAKVLPRAGAVAMLGGLAYLVSLGLNRGWITPAMLFGFVCIVCLAFVGAGLRIREEREQFGQILIAIGGGGLYMNFAAGHVFQHLYSGEVLVVLCLGLSLTVIGGSLWLGSLAFLVLGALGGLGAALMPLDQGKVALNLILHFTVLVAALLVAMRHRFLIGAMSLYGIGMAACLPLALSPSILAGHYLAPAMAFAFTAGLSAIAYGFCFKKQPWDPQEAFGPLAILAGGFAVLVAGQWRDAFWPLLLLVAVTGSGALFLPAPRPRLRLWMGSSAVLCWIVPFVLSEVVAAMVLAAAALVTGLLGVRTSWRGFALLSGVGVALASFPYTYVLGNKLPPWGTEATLLVLLIGATCASGRATWIATRASMPSWESAILNVVVLAVGGTFARLAFLLLFDERLTPDQIAILLGFALFSLMSSAASSLFRRKEIAWIGPAFLGLAGLAYFNVMGLESLAHGWDLLSLLFLFGACLAAGRALWSTVGSDRSSEPVILNSAAVAAGVVFVRLVYVVLWKFHLTSEWVAVVAGLVLLAYILCGVSIGFKRRDLAPLAAIVFAMSSAIYVQAVLDGLAWSWDLGCLLFLFAGCFLTSRTGWLAFSDRDPSAPATILDATVVATGTVVARLLFVILAALRLGPTYVEVVLACAAVSLAISFLGTRSVRAHFGLLATSFALVAGAFYAVALQGPVAEAWEVASNVSVLLAWLASLAAMKRGGAPFSLLAGLGTLGVWVIVSRLGVVTMGSAGVGPTTAVTVTWLLLAAVLLGLGFARDVVELRYASFALMGMTAGKVVLVDLAQVDPAIRVLLLMGLGAVMLCGGYWTIRRERKLTPRT